MARRLRSADSDGFYVFFSLALWLALLGGWIANVVKIAFAAGDPITGLFIFRVIGAFVLPIGAVLGWV